MRAMEGGAGGEIMKGPHHVEALRVERVTVLYVLCSKVSVNLREFR